jgi:hypothetical protein
VSDIAVTPAGLTVSLGLQAPTVTVVGALVGSLQLIVSGVTVVNAIGLKPYTLSALWTASGGGAPYTYSWLFEQPAGSATASAITRSVSAGSGDLRQQRLSAVLTDSGGIALASAVLLHVRHVAVPNLFDGHVQEASQRRRRVWPT